MFFSINICKMFCLQNPRRRKSKGPWNSTGVCNYRQQGQGKLHVQSHSGQQGGSGQLQAYSHKYVFWTLCWGHGKTPRLPTPTTSPSTRYVSSNGRLLLVLSSRLAILLIWISVMMTFSSKCTLGWLTKGNATTRREEEIAINAIYTTIALLSLASVSLL